MKKNKIERNVVSLPLQEVGIANYPDSLDKEFEFIKGIEYDKDPNPDDPRIQTSIDKFILFRPELKKLYKFLQREVDSYVENILHSSTKLKINSSWVAMNNNGGRCEPHTHVSVINGCFYINVPDDKTPLILDTYNCLGVREGFDISVKNNDLVLWDNKLSHWVPSNKNKETRYSLAFNTSYAEQFEFSLALAEAFNNPNSDVKNIKNNKGEVPSETTDTIIKSLHSNNLKTDKNNIIK